MRSVVSCQKCKKKGRGLTMLRMWRSDFLKSGIERFDAGLSGVFPVSLNGISRP